MNQNESRIGYTDIFNDYGNTGGFTLDSDLMKNMTRGSYWILNWYDNYEISLTPIITKFASEIPKPIVDPCNFTLWDQRVFGKLQWVIID